MAVALRDLPLWALSWVVWRLVPGRSAAKMAEFSHTEAGSGLDMLAAVEETGRRELRRRYFRHAQDELVHSRLFRERAQALAPRRRTRAQAVLDDSGYIVEHGINTKSSLFAELGELEFLAFVWVHERRGAQQFGLYADLLADDADTAAMFDVIAKDERFHVAYARAELDRYRDREGRGGAVRWAVARVRGRRLLQAWLRLSRLLGDTLGRAWLSLAYLLVLGPASVLARLSEGSGRGFVPAPPGPVDAGSMA